VILSRESASGSSGSKSPIGSLARYRANARHSNIRISRGAGSLGGTGAVIV